MSACRVSTVSPREEGTCARARGSSVHVRVWSGLCACGAVCVHLYVSTNASFSRSANPLASGPAAGTHAGERSSLVVRSKLRIDLRIAKLLARPLAHTNTHSHVHTHRHICTPIYRWDMKYGSIRHDAPGSSPSRTATAKRTRTSRCSEKEQAAQATAGVSASAACVRACTERAPREPLCGQGATPLPSAAGFRSGSGRTRPGRLNETNRPVAGPYVHTIHMDNITCKYGDRWIYGWTDGWMDRWMDR